MNEKSKPDISVLAIDLRYSGETKVYEVKDLYRNKLELEVVFGPIKVKLAGEGVGYLKMGSCAPINIAAYNTLLMCHKGAA